MTFRGAGYGELDPGTAEPILSSAVGIFENKARSPAVKLTGHPHKTGRLLHREEQAPASLSDESLSAPSGSE